MDGSTILIIVPPGNEGEWSLTHRCANSAVDNWLCVLGGEREEEEGGS